MYLSVEARRAVRVGRIGRYLHGRAEVWKLVRRVNELQRLNSRAARIEPVGEGHLQAVAFIDTKNEGARTLVTPQLSVTCCQRQIIVDFYDIALEREHHATRIEAAEPVVEDNLVKGDDISRHHSVAIRRLGGRLRRNGSAKQRDQYQTSANVRKPGVDFFLRLLLTHILLDSFLLRDSSYRKPLYDTDHLLRSLFNIRRIGSIPGGNQKLFE